MNIKIRTIAVALIGMFVTACGSTHTAHITAQNSQYEFVIVDPVTSFCRSLHPEVLYPDELERQTLITSCMQLCSTTDVCNIILPDTLPTQVTPIN